MQPRFIALLDPTLAGKYISRRYSFSWLYTESTGSPKQFRSQVDLDIQRHASMHETIVESLGADTSLRCRGAAKWVSFLRPRVERLDSWSAALATTATLTAAAATVNATIVSRISGGVSLALTVCGFVFAASILLFRFGVDRQRLWYKYLIAHLEAIKATQAAGGT